MDTELLGIPLMEFYTDSFGSYIVLREDDGDYTVRHGNGDYRIIARCDEFSDAATVFTSHVKKLTEMLLRREAGE